MRAGRDFRVVIGEEALMASVASLPLSLSRSLALSHLPREGHPDAELPSICSLRGGGFSSAVLSGASASSGLADPNPSVRSGPAAPDPICPPASSRLPFASTWAAAIALGLTLRFLSSLWCAEHRPAALLLWGFFLKIKAKQRETEGCRTHVD